MGWCNISRFEEKGKEKTPGIIRLKVHDDGDADVVQATACSRRTKAAQRLKWKRKRKRERMNHGFGKQRRRQNGLKLKVWFGFDSCVETKMLRVVK